MNGVFLFPHTLGSCTINTGVVEHADDETATVKVAAVIFLGTRGLGAWVAWCVCVQGFLCLVTRLPRGLSDIYFSCGKKTWKKKRPPMALRAFVPQASNESLRC